MTDRSPHPPASLQTAAMQPVWEAVRNRLDRYGPGHRSHIKLGRLPTEASLVLRSLMDSSGTRVDLDALEASLVALGVADDLDASLTVLGHPPSQPAAERRAARVRAAEVRKTLERSVRGWPEPWAPRWAADVSSSGAFAKLQPAEVASLTADVRRLLDVLDGGAASLPLTRDRNDRHSRIDIAARLFGSSHALDSQTLRERLCRRALALRAGRVAVSADESALSEHEIWEASGVHLDRVSSPILTWGLDFHGDTAVAELARLSTRAGVPFPITTAALERWPLAGNRHRGPILVVENPRVVEAAADANVGFAVVTTNGNPRRNVTTLVGDLVAAGNDVYYHGDFDSAGLAICARMIDLGCRPFAMADEDYRAACDRASAEGIPLPVDDHPSSPTPWSPQLQRSFNDDRGRRIVHEELLLPALLAFAP